MAAMRAATFGAPQPRITTPTLRGVAGQPIALRPLRQRDVASVVATCQDLDSARWSTVPVPYTTVDGELFVTDHGPGRWLRGEGAVFAIADGDDNFVGSVQLRLTGPRSGDVGYVVAPWARGRGYASAALRAVCAWGFEFLGLHRIEWQAYVGNDASRRVAEKAGFIIEGVARGGCLHRERYLDAWTGAKLATDPR
jgi:RimJ/RimL family protein N-acetyltransferase